MPKRRIDIDNEEVLKCLKMRKYGVADLARKFGCSTSLIRSVREGYRKKGKIVDIDEKDLCTRCGIREKGEGLRYFCDRCFRTVSNGIEYPVNLKR